MSKKAFLAKIRRMSTEEKEQLIKKIEQTADFNERTYYGCSQCTLAALQLHLNIGDAAVFKAASALAGGIARSGEVCGALAGGIMAIGLVYGRDKLEDLKTSPSYQEAMERSGRLCDRFKKEFGKLRCRDVQKAVFGRSWDLRNPEENEQFFNRLEADDKCANVISKTARLAAEVILEPLESEYRVDAS